MGDEAVTDCAGAVKETTGCSAGAEGGGQDQLPTDTEMEPSRRRAGWGAVSGSSGEGKGFVCHRSGRTTFESAEELAEGA